MHPLIEFPGKLAPLFEALALPLYDGGERNPARVAMPFKEVSLAEGYHVVASGFGEAKWREEVIGDFHRFMAGAMQVDRSGEGVPITISQHPLPEHPHGHHEAYRLRITAQGCEVVAEELEGVRRALYRLQDEMLIREAPVLPLTQEARSTRLRTRISRCPLAPYRWLSGWELEDEHDYYPDAYLERLAQSGVNALWVPGLLRNLVASKVLPELGPPSHRLGKLRGLVERCSRYGIRIYLFVTEPRALTDGHRAGLAHPEIRGANQSLCPSVPIVLDYVREVMASLFAQVPELAGVINIFCGERPTHCWINDATADGCPRCRDRSKTEVLAQLLNSFVEGIRESSPRGEFLAWTYMMASSTESLPIAPMLDVMNASSQEIIWLGNFEHGSTKEIVGRKVEIHEYSLSCLGPSPHFRDLATEARAAGRTLYAKLQMGSSYEMSSVPYLPVPGIVHTKIEEASRLGADGAMLGWIIGGMPSPMLRLAGEAAFEPRLDKTACLLRVAAIEWGERAASEVASAWALFSDIWQRYPFHNAVLYWGPITRAPAYHLQLEREPRGAKPYNWGTNRKREPQPWEDHLERWLGFYTAEEIITSFRSMAGDWKQGLCHLEAAMKIARPTKGRTQQMAVASAVYHQCLSTANVYEFYSLRNELRGAPVEDHPRLLNALTRVCENEVCNAEAVLKWIDVDPTIGFQSEIYDFSYSRPLIEAKLIQVAGTLATLSLWIEYGVDQATLERTIEEREFRRPDWEPDQWGD